MGADEPRPELLRAKLTGLVRAAGGADPELLAGRLPGGVVAAAEPGGTVWVLVESGPARALGPVLLWLHREGAWDRANLVLGTPPASTLVALRLAAFHHPPALWTAEGTERRRVEVPDLAAAASQAGHPRSFDRDEVLAPLRPPARTLAGELLDEAQRAFPFLDVEREQDAVVLSVAGLEVARLAVAGDDAVFEVGVGAIDQDARRRVVGERLLTGSSVEADLADLGEAVAVVQRHRHPGGPPHPLRRLQRSRWLRAEILADPRRAGFPAELLLEPVADPVPKESLNEDLPAGAVGSGEVLVCSAGIDLGAVPTAGHVWLQAVASGDRARLTLAVAKRDLHPATEDLAGRLHPDADARLVAVDAPWDP